MAHVEPGVAFWLVTDSGFVVGVVNQNVPRLGALVWMSDPTFDEQPDLATAQGITSWRWPIFFPLGTYLRRKVAVRLGRIRLPQELAGPLVMRSRAGKEGWNAGRIGGPDIQLLGPTSERHLPIYQVVNDVALKELIVTGWRPEQTW